jgi:hypothetical protein
MSRAGCGYRVFSRDVTGHFWYKFPDTTGFGATLPASPLSKAESDVMSNDDEILNHMHIILKDKGMGDFHVKELQIVPKRNLRGRESQGWTNENSDILRAVQHHLRTSGSEEYHVSKLDLALRLSGPSCKDGEILKHVREEMADGTIKWSLKCVKA